LHGNLPHQEIVLALPTCENEFSALLAFFMMTKHLLQEDNAEKLYFCICNTLSQAFLLQ